MTAEAAIADPLIGEILADRYQVLERLGEGAMGTVYKARHIKVGRWFAVKVLHARLLEDSKTALRFGREAELAGRLRHANVVGVVDVGEISGRHYMVMDFAEGPDLAELLGEAPMRPERIINLTRQILEGLYHAHEQGLIHRDLKPENVIIERDNHGDEMPRIVDFGIAILRDGGDAADGANRLTTNGLVLGTPHYMAPEQAVADPIDHRIDLFALGIMVYEMLSGYLPFDGSGAEVARANLLLDPPPIKHRVPYLEVDPLLEAFSRRLMAKKPSARPATAKAARELLDLIERDRDAAAAALGVPTAMRLPATTEPVALQAWPTPDQVATAAIQVPTTVLATTELPTAAMLTKQMRPTPSPRRALSPLGSPSSLEAPPPPATSLALSSPGLPAAIAMPTGDARSAPRRSRWPLLFAGIAIGAAGLVGAMWFMAEDDGVGAPAPKPAVAAPAEHAAPRSTGEPAAPVAPTAPPPEVAAPVAPTASPPEVATAPAPIASDPAPPTESRATPARPSKRTRPAGRSPGAAPQAAAPAAIIVEPRPDPARPPGPPRGEPRPAVEPNADLRAPTTGATPAAIADLYYKIAGALGQLPGDKSQDLRDRLRAFNVQELMLAAPAVRDAAVAPLQQLLRETRQRKTAP